MTKSSSGDSLYEDLRDHLGADGKYRIPRRKQVLEILRLRFTPEEAILALHMPVLGQSRVNLKELVERTGGTAGSVRSVLDGMVRKGAVLAQSGRTGVEVYCLWDFLYSLYSPIYGDGFDNDVKRRIADLREELWHDGYHHIWFSSSFPFNRVLPHEGAIAPNQVVEPWEKASEYVKKAGVMAVIACGCRASTKRCNKPLWTCVYFDTEADYWVKYRGGRYINQEECLELLERTAKAGLVMTRANDKGLPRVICNCCNDCCLILRHHLENRSPYALAKSNFIARIDESGCRQCATCQKMCPVSAIGRVPAHKQGKRDRMIVVEENCIGCGVCSLACPNNAVRLYRARSLVPENTLRDAFSRYAREELW